MKLSEKTKLDNYIEIRDYEYKYLYITYPQNFYQWLNNWQASNNSIYEEYRKYWWWYGVRQRELAFISDSSWEGKNVSPI